VVLPSAGVSLMLNVLIPVKYDSPVEFSMEQLMNPDAMDQATYDRILRNECYQNAIKTLIPFMHKRGLLDPVENEE
jgi:hypothetical protein